MPHTQKPWRLRPGVTMDDQTAAHVATIATALKALSIHATLLIDRNDCPEDLQRTVEQGVSAIDKVFEITE